MFFNPKNYISKNRIQSSGSNTPTERIVQPPPPSIAKVQQTTNSPASNKLDAHIEAAADWLYQHNWPVIPEITSNPSSTPIEDLAVVVSHTGANALRYKANDQAMTRMMHANPRPKYFIFVEFVNNGEVAHYSSLEENGWDKVITINTTDKGRNVWQKEAMWNVGAKYAFSLPGITKCMFLDADTAFHDNSWCAYISNCLNAYDVIQAFEGVYYADQPDCKSNYYGPKHVCVSTAWSVLHDGKSGAPGGSYACTKHFFEDVLGGYWPYSSRGSGDACLWLFLKGTRSTRDFPMHCDFRLSDKEGAYNYAHVGYAPLLAIHFYHGPLSNRMYGSRDYLLRKSNIFPGSDVTPNENGVLEWTDTYEGRFMVQATDMLFAANTLTQQKGRPVLSEEIKDITRNLRQNIYGHIDTDHPLHIVTYADDSVKDKDIIKLADSIKTYCQTPYRFIVLSNRDIEGVATYRYKEIPLQKCAGAWKRLAAFNHQCDENTTILFIDPSVVIHRNFVINRCPDKHIYMARPFILAKEFGHCNWDSSIMMFRNAKGLYEQYLKDLNSGAYRNPEYQFFDPSDYINAYAHFNGYTCRNITAQVDYAYNTQTYFTHNAKLSEFVLQDK